jgi:two-component system, CAI-1 autoinducer sensor kinase/phosphatase CqsS
MHFCIDYKQKYSLLLTMMHRIWKRLKDWFITPELEVILHPSRRRLQWLGFFTLVGNLSFWWLWTYALPQSFEDWRLRAVIAATGIGLILQPAGNQCQAPLMKLYYSFVSWLQLPLFFVWMYWMNSGSAMWMATVATMIVVYYHLTDWRLASLGLASGALIATALAHQIHGNLNVPPAEHAIVFLFAWISAVMLALSSANLRRERLQHSLNVIGIMAHELRTPLATMALIAQAIRMESVTSDHQHEERLDDLATRMDALARTINHHIDLQMANARYTYQPQNTQLVSAEQLVQRTLQDYPFGSRRERQCVQLVPHTDFWFHGSERQFTQVLNNLLKNALHSLKSAQSRYDHGDIRIEIGARDLHGRIQIKDRGIGINSRQLPLIFEPFFSTANETGHGLGLAFCKQVVEAAHGTIMVQSEPAMGATLTLQLPCQPAPSEQKSSDHEISPLSPA